MMRLALLFVAVSTLAVVAWAGSVGYDAFLSSPAADAQAVSFRVEPGWSVKQTAASLEQEHLIKSAWTFQTFAKLTGMDGSIKAGTFPLKPGMSYAAIVAALTVSLKGEQVQVTIPEGLTAHMVGATVRASLPGISEADWDAATGKSSPLLSDPILSNIPKGQGLEGYLFPDTYQFRPDATAEDVVREMLLTLSRRLAEKGIAPDADFGKTLTLASIIQREAPSISEMPDIAGVFHNRLDAGMPLQSDATIRYATQSTADIVTYDDLKVDSPYNTYAHPGLPPGPICNPGTDAILAALHPAANPYFYFLTAPDGTVKYARTYDEHLHNRARYLP
jgi:UPF0755 protein